MDGADIGVGGDRRCRRRNGLRGYSIHKTQILAIDAPSGINEALLVRIGGIDQWVQIRGQNRDNPVLQWLHGGRDFRGSSSPWTFQRGDRKTFEKYGRSIAGTMTMERMAQDGIEVAEYLKDHLNKDKIILLGHSWVRCLGYG